MKSVHSHYETIKILTTLKETFSTFDDGPQPSVLLSDEGIDQNVQARTGLANSNSDANGHLIVATRRTTFKLGYRSPGDYQNQASRCQFHTP